MARWVGPVAVCALVLVACGGADEGSGPRVDDAAGPEAADHVAVLDVIEDAADVRRHGADDYEGADTGQELRTGDSVRTDGTGFVEVTYVDGSLTRLDADTEFTLVDLVDVPEASVVRSQLEPGRTWQRVHELAGDDRFEVETAVAVAAVRGTAFVVDCGPDDACLFAVVAGEVEVSTIADLEVTLSSGESVMVAADGDLDEEVRPIPDELGEWIRRNLDLDIAAGFDEIVSLDRDDDIHPCRTTGTIDGGWSASFVDVPTQRSRFVLDGQDAGASYLFEEDGWEVSIDATAVFIFGPDGRSLGLAEDDGGSYDVGEDGARVVDEREAHADSPETLVDLTVTC